jgi:hypothetical protein
MTENGCALASRVSVHEQVNVFGIGFGQAPGVLPRQAIGRRAGQGSAM